MDALRVFPEQTLIILSLRIMEENGSAGIQKRKGMVDAVFAIASIHEHQVEPGSQPAGNVGIIGVVESDALIQQLFPGLPSVDLPGRVTGNLAHQKLGRGQLMRIDEAGYMAGPFQVVLQGNPLEAYGAFLEKAGKIDGASARSIFEYAQRAPGFEVAEDGFYGFHFLRRHIRENRQGLGLRLGPEKRK